MSQLRERKRRDLGILFVHGIGQGKEGDTLVSFGESFVNVLRQLLEERDESDPGRDLLSPQVEVKSVRLHHWAEGAPTPAHAELLLKNIGGLLNKKD